MLKWFRFDYGNVTRLVVENWKFWEKFGFFLKNERGKFIF